MASTAVELMRRRMGSRSASIDWEALYKAALDSQYASGQLIIPEGITAIKGSQFSGCSGFTGELVIPSSVTSIGSYSFNACSGITSFIIKAQITTVPTWAFAACSGATLVDLPSTLTTASNAYALRFSSCLTLICRAVTPPTLSSMSFQVNNSCNIYVPDEAVNDYKTANIWSNYASRIFPISDLTT